MLYPKIPLAQNIIQICQSKGIKNIVISPGSRNAPLTIGFTNNPFFTCYSIADERCAGFFALGISQQNQESTVLVCTSGSALLNYYPAVAEAFYSQIPLIIISADRPFHKIDIGDGQTIRQEHVFENHIIGSFNLTENPSEQNTLNICTAVDIANTQKGPVHINAPFEEPLYEVVTELENNKLEITKPLVFENKLENLDEFASIWNKSKKKLIVVGEYFPHSIDENITNKLANDSSVVVMTENISNWHHPKFISNIDAIITPFTIDDFIIFSPKFL